MRCTSCGHANEAGSAYCAACYRNFPLPPRAPGHAFYSTAAPAPASAAAPAHAPPAATPAAPADAVSRVPGYAWGLGWAGVCVLLLFLATLPEMALGSLRTSADGAALRSDATILLPAAGFCFMLAVGAVILLFHRPRGPLMAGLGVGVGVLAGTLVALSVAFAARSLSRAALHDGTVANDSLTLSVPVALLLILGGSVVLGMARDRATAFAILALAGLVATAVALAGTGWWIADNAASLQAAARERERHYSPFPAALGLASALLVGLLLRRAARRA